MTGFWVTGDHSVRVTGILAFGDSGVRGLGTLCVGGLGCWAGWLLCYGVSPPRKPPPSPQVKLDVTLGDLTKLGKSQKQTLSVDVEGGRLVVLRRQRDAQEDWNTFTHDKSAWGALGGPTPQGLCTGGGSSWVSPSWVRPHPVWGSRCPTRPRHPPNATCPRPPPIVRQLIKSQRVQNKLGIVFEKEKDKTQRKDFVFVSARVGPALLGRGGAGFDPWSPAGVWGRVLGVSLGWSLHGEGSGQSAGGGCALSPSLGDSWVPVFHPGGGSLWVPGRLLGPRAAPAWPVPVPMLG